MQSLAPDVPIELFTGTDRLLDVTVRTFDQTKVDGIGDTVKDITGWALSFVLKRRKGDADVDALLTKTTAGGGVTIAGTFNADPLVNSQRLTVAIADSDTDALTPGLAHYEVKRTDAGLEVVLVYGTCRLQRALHRS